MKGLRDVTILISLLMFMLSGIIVQTVDYSNLTNILMIVGGIIIIIITVKHMKLKEVSFDLLDLLFVIFIFLGLISSILNKDTQNLMSIFKQLFIYIVLVICQRLFITTDKYLKGFFLAGIIIIGLSILTVPIVSGARSYRGIFGNPNNFGTFMSAFGGVGLTWFISSFIYKKNIINSILSFGLLLLTLLLISLSSSRTALIAIVTVSVLIVLPYAKNYVKNSMYRDRNSLTISLIIFLLAAILIYNTSFFQSILQNFISKMSEKQGDLLASRDVIWSFYLKNARLFGHQNNYLTNIIEFSAHSSFIAQIGQFGWFAGVAYILYWLIVLIKSLKFFFVNIKYNSLSVFPIITILLFLFMSMMEVMTHKEIAFLAFVSIGYIQKHEAFQVEKNFKTCFNYSLEKPEVYY